MEAAGGAINRRHEGNSVRGVVIIISTVGKYFVSGSLIYCPIYVNSRWLIQLTVKTREHQPSSRQDRCLHTAADPGSYATVVSLPCGLWKKFQLPSQGSSWLQNGRSRCSYPGIKLELFATTSQGGQSRHRMDLDTHCHNKVIRELVLSTLMPVILNHVSREYVLHETFFFSKEKIKLRKTNHDDGQWDWRTSLSTHRFIDQVMSPE